VIPPGKYDIMMSHDLKHAYASLKGDIGYISDGRIRQVYQIFYQVIKCK